MMQDTLKEGFKDINMGEFGRHLFKKLLKATASASSYADVLEQVDEQNLTKYTDESFPPNEHSLINDWNEPDVQGKVELWRNFEWTRCEEMRQIK